MTFIEGGEIDPGPQMTIYLISNDIHTDIALPVKNEVFDWETFLNKEDFKIRSSSWIEVGWGDRQFYFDMPTWDHFTWKLAADALFWPDPAVMHVTYLDRHPSEFTTAQKVNISYKTYKKMVDEYLRRFKTKDSKPIIIPDKGYDQTDNFYEAEGSYSIVRTCNEWTSEILAVAGLPHPLWAPTKHGIHRIYQKYQ